MDIDKLDNFMVTDEQKEILITNVLKMLSNRIFIKNAVKEKLINLSTTSVKNYIKDNVKDLNDDIYEIKTNHTTYYLKLYFLKINSINKPTSIGDFLDKYKKYQKIIIAEDFGNKALKEFNKRDNLQIFKEATLMEDIVEHYLQPKFHLLTEEEMNKVREEYICNDKHFSREHIDDAITEYYNLKPGDI